MSESWLVVVPQDPLAAPAADAVQQARDIVAAALTGAAEIRVERSATPQFVDAGVLLERVGCPRCGADLGDWWADAMDAAHAHGFTDLSVVTPCCGAPTSLDELDYDAPQAFARVAIHVRDAGVDALEPEAQAAVERRLGVPVRVIRRRL